MSVKYAEVDEVRLQDYPKRHYGSYGGKIPTQYKVLFNKRWYKVYAICYSNAASFYITAHGEQLFIRDVVLSCKGVTNG